MATCELFTVRRTSYQPFQPDRRRIFVARHEFFCSEYNAACEERMKRDHGGSTLYRPPPGHSHIDAER